MSGYTSNLSCARREAVSRLGRLLNSDLKEICRNEHLGVSGAKAFLQQRIIGHLDSLVASNDIAGFERVKYYIDHQGRSPQVSYSGSGAPQAHHSTRPSHTNGHANQPPNRPSLPNPSMAASRQQPAAAARLNFRPSPFYHVQEHLTRIQDLSEMPSNRHTVSTTIILSAAVCEALKADSSLRIMLYCTSSSLLSSYEMSEIAFPSQIEVRVNQDEVKSNYKGLKNKPGTTKPADLTQFVRKLAGYANTLQVNYALTTRRYSYVVNLVKTSSVTELTDRIRNGRSISKDSVLREMISRAQDPDIEATSSTVTLKDPVSTMRMDVPCRSTICPHIQCFDALCFIQLQEQAPTWSCPVCSRTISYETLAVDQYFQDILQRTSKDIEQVTVEPQGQWHEVRQAEPVSTGKKQQARATWDNDSDDDLVEITEVGGAAIKKDPIIAATPTINFHMTPPLSSRETSVAQVHGAGSGSKNKRSSAVIDLTASDDEDEPIRRPKRQTTSYLGTPTSAVTPSNSTDARPGSAQTAARPTLPSQTLYSGFAQMRSSIPAEPPRAGITASQSPVGSGGPNNDSQNRHMPWPQNFANSTGGNPWLGNYAGQ